MRSGTLLHEQIKGIPTTYRDVRMRSRLEARWAAFFDMAGWRWEYEPIDEVGWIPDFLLIGKYDVVKVEVKPIAWTFQSGDSPSLIPAGDYGLGKVRSYIATSRAALPHDELYREDVLLLGAYPQVMKDIWTSVALGVFLNEGHAMENDVAILNEGYEPYPFDFHSLYGAYRYRMGGQYEGDCHLKGGANPDTVRRLWAEAGNIVQWKKAA